jgi:hypothetical protein
MMKTLLVLVLILLTVWPGFSKLLGPMPEVMKPDNITISENELYIVEGSEISIYSLKDLKLIQKFGKKGEGPGEFISLPNFYNKIIVFPDYLLVEGANKMIYFSKQGELIKEKKKSLVAVLAIPLGENYVLNRFKQGEDKLLYSTVTLCNPELEEIKELYRQKHVQQGVPPTAKLDIVMDFVYFSVCENKIFIERSPEGFIVDVYDQQGKKLYRIEKEYEKIEVTEDHKQEIIELFKNDPNIKQASQQFGGWNELKKMITLNFPKYYPPIQEMVLTGNKIYLQTYKLKDNQSEYVVMDLKGNIIKRVYLPRFENTPLMAKLLGAKRHTIYNDKLYYLLENEDEEEWELYMEDLK